MDLLDYLAIIRKHGRVITLLCLTATVTAAAIAYVLPQEYEATALVLVEPQEGINISQLKSTKEILNFPITGGAMKAETPSNTYIEAIKSRVIAEKVVSALHLDRDREVPDARWHKRLTRSLRKMLRNRLRDVKQLAKHGWILGPSPPFEKAVENFQKSISMKAIKDTYIFEIAYSDEEPQGAAAAANQAATLFLAELTSLHANDARGTLEFLGEQLRTADVSLAERRQLMREFKESHQTVMFKDEAVANIKLIGALETDLEKTQAKLAGLLATMTPANPQVRSMQAELNRLDVARAEHRKQLQELPAKERELARLQLNLKLGEDIYEVIHKEYQQAQIRVGSMPSEMKLVSPAAPPLYPARPIFYYYVGGGFAFALVAGVGLAFLLEYSNTTIRTVEHAESALGVRVLATPPVIEFPAQAA